ncbi:MAG: YhjD/YihY/BrkB family envelope integrity protein, partial [Silvibacterium sp.]
MIEDGWVRGEPCNGELLNIAVERSADLQTLAIAMGVLLTTATIIVMYGPIILHKIAPGSAPLYVWNITLWLAAAVLLILALFCLYRFAPNSQEKKWKWLLPGSIVATVVWMAVSVLFKVY